MQLHDYELAETLSESSRSQLRRGIRRHDGARVLLEILSEEFPSARDIRRIEFEHRLLEKLNVPGVIEAIGVARDGERRALVAKDIGAAPLSRKVGTAVPLDTFFSVACATVQVLSAIHAKGVIHQRIQPRSILFEPRSNSLQLSDFGDAVELSLHQPSGWTDDAEGFLPYMSPEQTGRMNRAVDYRTDYYSLGVTFFTLLAGAYPFAASDPLSWVHCHISRPPPRLADLRRELPEALCQIVTKLMAKSPDDRYQSARGLLHDLERCAAEWGQSGSVQPFGIGQHDLSERFLLPQKLFGREAELGQLRACFEHGSPARLLLVAGHSGVGKSSLINELQGLVAARHGVFAKGKFDQLERDIPYDALAQALGDVLEQLLAEPEAQLSKRRTELLAALGGQAQVLIEWLPELEKLLGLQPPVGEVGAREAKVRFQGAFRQFMGALATAEHPLVLVLDDLQWTDAATAEMLVHLLRAGSRGLLIIGAYRDNEVGEGHVLQHALEQIRKEQATAIERVELGPLSMSAVNEIVAAALHREPAEVEAVAELVYAKTAGNPYFVNELSGMFHRAGAFRFDGSAGRWVWDLAQIQQTGVTDNVVDLLIGRLRSFPATLLEYLSAAACVGSEFDLHLLSRVAGRSPVEIATALQPAVHADFIVPLGDAYRWATTAREHDASLPAPAEIRYRFQHDRVQQAAHSLLDEAGSAAIHLTLGRTLLVAMEQSGDDRELFAIVNHLNRARRLQTSLDERRHLARLNYMAGLKAKRSTAFSMSKAHFETSLGLLSPEEWSVHPELRFEYTRARIESTFMAGSAERAASECDALIDLASDNLTRIAALQLKAAVYTFQLRSTEALDAIRLAVAGLGLNLPSNPAETGRMIGEGIGRLKAHLARTPLDQLIQLPSMTAPEKLLAMDVLALVTPAALQVDPPLATLSELLMFDLSMNYGLTARSAANLVSCGHICGGSLQDYATGYALGQAGLKLLDRFAPSPFETSALFRFANFVSPWRKHYSESLESYERSFRAGIASGDTPHAAFARALRVHRLFITGHPLDYCEAEAQMALEYVSGVRALVQQLLVNLPRHAMACLKGSALPPGIPSDEAFDQMLVASRSRPSQFLHAQARGFVRYLLGDLAGAERWCECASQHLPAAQNLMALADYHLLHALVLVRNHVAAPPGERAAIRAALSGRLNTLELWARNCPENFGHKHELLRAELLHLDGAPVLEVNEIYDRAVQATGDGFLQYRALARELQAEFWLSHGQPRLAETYGQEAHYLYERWGAAAKLTQLERTHPEWCGSRTKSWADDASTSRATRASSNDGLDIHSVIKATQAISGEVRRDRLFERLLAAIIENAGAQRGLLILAGEGDGKLEVEARAQVEELGAEPLCRGSVEECRELCPDIVRYVARTGETLVIDDARVDPRYAHDTYVRSNAVKAVLCVPVPHQGRLLAVLYAENNAATHAFTPDRVSLLQVIASQAAISISNARLYDILEEKVAERTAALSAQNQEMATLFDAIRQGIFTIDEELRVQARYSAHLADILGTTDIAGRDCMDLLFAESSIAGDAREAARSALMFGLGVPAYVASTNADHLIREYTLPHPDGGRRYFELDWHWISGEDGLVRAVLCALRDVTTLRQLKEAAAQKTRELDIVSQVIEAGVSRFNQFSQSARNQLAECAELCDVSSGPETAALNVIARHLHTIKGNARLYQFSHLVECVHGAEGELRAWRAAADGVGRLPSEVATLVARVRSMLQAYEDLCRRKLGESAAGNSERQRRALDEVSDLLEQLASGVANSARVLSSIDAVVARGTATELRELVRDCARMLPSLARELDKPSPSVHCDTVGVALRARWANVVRDCLVHALRNSIDHGLESASERTQQGKQPQGTISVRASVEAGRVMLLVQDDGRGLPLGALSAQSERTGASDEELAESAFEAGRSTAGVVSTISGRGIGLDAIRSFLRARGGDARIVFTGKRRGEHRPFQLVFELPRSAALLEGLSPEMAKAAEPAGRLAGDVA